ncbi:MAG TPA: PhnD/SsuA/transferrin family substrate-binding protein [Methylophilaceae bacterium]
MASVTSVAGAEYPKKLRISTFAFVVDGKTTIRGTPLVDRVIDERWLEQELAKRGVELEWYPIVGDTGAVTNEALASGRVDFANIGDLPSVLLNAGGVRTAVIVPSGRGSDMYLLVPAGSGSSSIRDLKGKRISVHRGRPWELGLRRLIESEGMKVGDFRIFNLDPRAGAAALAAGKVDAHFANNGPLLEESGLGKIIWSTKGKPPHFKFRAEIWGKRDFIDRYPELTQLVATAFVKAAHWASLDANREEVIRIAMRNKTPEVVVRRTYEDDSLSWKERWSPLVDDAVRQHFREVVEFARKERLIARTPDPETLVEPRFVNEAIRTLGLEGHWTPWRNPK